jgi:3-oxoacyl-[acyl-carrier protein] reductase
MDLGLTGRVALVGASSKGLGRATAFELAREGASLILCARGEDALERTRGEIVRETGAEVLAVAADLTTAEGVQRVVDAAAQRFARVDILVTNTGGPPAGLFEHHDAAAWREAYTQLLDAPVALVRAFLPAMRQARWGRIIAVTSIAVKQPVDGLILSNSLRAAVTGFARTLANEVARDGVTVNTVLPGYTRTDRVIELAQRTAERTGTTEAAAYEKWEREIPAGRIGEPEEFAALVAFLASARASYITGSAIAVDGGWIRSLL